MEALKRRVQLGRDRRGKEPPEKVAFVPAPQVSLLLSGRENELWATRLRELLTTCSEWAQSSVSPFTDAAASEIGLTRTRCSPSHSGSAPDTPAGTAASSRPPLSDAASPRSPTANTSPPPDRLHHAPPPLSAGGSTPPSQPAEATRSHSPSTPPAATPPPAPASRHGPCPTAPYQRRPHRNPRCSTRRSPPQ